MASFPVGDLGCTAELPSVRVGVIRHQGETLLSPSHDVVPFLQAQTDDRWRVTVFDERDFGGALGAAADLDVILLGYNATPFTPDLVGALCRTAPTAPVLMLHQRDQVCFSFLRNELELEAVKLGDGVREAVTPRERAAEFEPLLNWPHADVTLDGRLAVKAIRGLSFSPDGSWRVVMVAQRGAQRLPVLVRTRADHAQRIVACSLLLRPAAEKRHGTLLENLLIYCAFGWPDVALVDDLTAEPATRRRVLDLEDGMRMWTKRAVRLTVPEDAALRVDAWPLRGVGRIVAPAGYAAKDLQGADAWLRRGGEISSVAADGVIAGSACLDDRFIVLRDWALWFSGLPEQAWIQRLSRARAVLRMLAEVGAPEWTELAEHIRFPVSPADYAGEIRAVLRARVARGNVDETISATATALDLDSLTGGDTLPPFTRTWVRRWLKDHLHDATRGDQLEILRCVADAALLEHKLKEWRSEWDPTNASRRVDALVATRLREAVHACWPDEPEPAGLLGDQALAALDSDDVVQDLHKSPLLSAEFLAAVYSRRPGEPSELFAPGRFERSIAAATDRVRADGLFTETHDVGAVCAHTLAILRHLDRHPAGLRFLAGRNELPSSVAESVLQEATKARANEREARRDLPALGRAVLIGGAITLGLATVGLLDLWGVDGVYIAVHPWWLVAPALAVPAIVLATLRWLVLERSKELRAERRDVQLGRSVMGLAGLALALAAATVVWRFADGGGIGLAITFGPLAGGLTFAVAMWLLSRIDLAPSWGAQLSGVLADPKSLLPFVTRRLPERGAKS